MRDGDIAIWHNDAWLLTARGVFLDALTRPPPRNRSDAAFILGMGAGAALAVALALAFGVFW